MQVNLNRACWLPGVETVVPQLWYWRTWDEGRFLTETELQKEHASFSQPIPANNHLPWLIKRETGKFPSEATVAQEQIMTISFLRLHEPLFTWNGDSNFWRSAAEAVGSAMNLLWRQKASWDITDIAKLTSTCLEFLAKSGDLLPESTVALSPEGQFDVLQLTPNETTWISRAKWPVSNGTA